MSRVKNAEIDMKIALSILLSLFTMQSLAQELVLSGTPSKMIEVDQFGDRRTQSDFVENKLQITKDGENYYWASRGNIPLARTSSGIYITYIAADGSGYIKTVNETAKAKFIEQSPDNTVGRYTYVEHITHDLTSITLYGN
jgi:hypothetical protein